MSNCTITNSFENNILTISLEGRIDSQNAADTERQVMEIRAANNQGSVEVDAEKLEYISSAGLRILLKLQKAEMQKASSQKILVKNVSSDIYEIFDVTGFVDILDVKKSVRKISIDGCKLIGKGGTAAVYRLDPDTIVKVFREGTSRDLIEQESKKAKETLKAGVQTAISFDTVQVGNNFGVIYELINSKDLIGLMEDDKENYKTYVERFAKFVREMHSIEVNPAIFPPVKAAMLTALKYLQGNFATADEVQKMIALWEMVPESNHFIHGDCHVGNVMLQDNELMFIDLSTIGSGHPVVDLVSMYFCFYFCSQYDIVNPNEVLMRSFTKEEGKDIWNTFVRAYFDTQDEAFINKITEQVDALACTRILLAQLSFPGMFKPEEFQIMKQHALAYYDKGLEPLCF